MVVLEKEGAFGMVEKRVQISGAESRIMEALWARKSLSVVEILEAVAPAQNWSDATVKTLIGRLLKKGAIQSSRVDGRVVYGPLVGRDAYIRSESQGLLDRLFGGDLAPLVAHFAQDRKLSPEERAQLQELLSKVDRDD